MGEREASTRGPPLGLGSILRIGWKVFITTNDDQEDTGRWVLAASHERKFYCSALLVYGSLVAVAEGIGVAETTFRDRIKRWAAQGDRMAQDPLHLAELQRHSKGERRRTHSCPSLPWPSAWTPCNAPMRNTIGHLIPGQLQWDAC